MDDQHGKVVLQLLEVRFFGACIHHRPCMKSITFQKAKMDCSIGEALKFVSIDGLEINEAGWAGTVQKESSERIICIV